jgi:hypothetical protein
MLADTSVADRHRFDVDPDLTFHFDANPDSAQILPQILLFLGPNGTRFARGHFRAQKSLDFQGPPLPMALEMDVAHIKIISSRPI